MKKSEQIAMNEKVLAFVQEYNATTGVYPHVPWMRLRSCSAEVAHLEHWYILRSYNTIVAVIDTTTDTLYDFLRYVYGYTSTSAQHISKFDKDYGAGKWGCAHRYTYKEV